MKIVTANRGKSLQISKAEWLRIGTSAGWTKAAQETRPVEVTTTDEVVSVLDGLGSTRFMIGYRKKNGDYRVMNAQRGVNKYKEDGSSDPSRAEVRRDHGLILVYDLSFASRKERELRQSFQEQNPEVEIDEEERKRIKEKALRSAYRSIYPDRVEMIKGRGRTWLVEGAQEPEIIDRINELQAAEEIPEEISEVVSVEE